MDTQWAPPTEQEFDKFQEDCFPNGASNSTLASRSQALANFVSRRAIAEYGCSRLATAEPIIRRESFMTNWKTTAAGILSALIGIAGPFSALLASLQAIKPMPNYTLAYIAAGATFIFAVARVWVGLLQNDAPPTSGTVPSPVPAQKV